MRSIGVFMYRLCVKIIIVGFLIVLMFLSSDLFFTPSGLVSLRSIVVSLVVMLGVFGMFVIPQMSIHNFLLGSKESVLTDLNTGYEDVQRALVQSINDPNYLKNQSRWKTHSEIIDHASALDRMISHVKSMGTWSFSFPNVLKLLAAAALPLLTAILQIVASGLLRQLIPI
jgi:glucan phosphoethanolaminetransferase (alkaline phosphatase superfamily)